MIKTNPANNANDNTRLSLSPNMSKRAFWVILALALTSCFVAGLIIVRAVWSGKLAYHFLIWNLFLAWIPFLCAYVINHLKHWNVFAIGLGLIWLLFLPNAPYLVTDLIHLRPYTENRFFWLDLVMLFSFAWLGAILSFLSIWLMHEKINLVLGKALGWFFVVATAFASGFGVYLGRFLRWNSWDIIKDPIELLEDIVSPFLNPLGHMRHIAFFVLFACMIFVGYITLYLISHLKSDK